MPMGSTKGLVNKQETGPVQKLQIENEFHWERENNSHEKQMALS